MDPHDYDFPRAVELVAGDMVDVRRVDGDGCSLLHVAAWRDDVEAVGVIVAAGGDVEGKECHGRTPLYAACCNGSVNVVNWMLNTHKIDPSDPVNRDNEGRTPLHAAVSSSKLDIITMLINYPTLLTSADTNGRNPLHTAVVTRSLTSLKHLLTQNSSLYPDGWLDAYDDDTATPLMLAVAMYNLDMVRELIEAGGDLDMLGWGVGHVSVFKNIDVEVGVDILEKDVAGVTPLHLAAGFGREKRLVEMMEGRRGTKVKRVEKKIEEMMKGDPGRGLVTTPEGLNLVRDVIKELQWDYESALSATDNHGRTPLHVAAQYSSSSMVTTILKLSPSLASVPDKYNWTPLHFTIDANNLQSTSILLSHGAPPTPEHITIASSKGNLDVLSTLLSYRTLQIPYKACIEAIDNNFEKTLKLLLQRLSPKDLTTPCDASPTGILGHALSSGNIPMVETLLSSRPDLRPELLTNAICSKKLTETKQVQILTFLLRRVSPSCESVISTAFLGLTKCLYLLLDKCFSINDDVPNVIDTPGRLEGIPRVTPLQAAILGNQRASVEVLLRYGADPSVGGSGMEPPLIAAINSNNDKIVKMLVEAGASPNEAGTMTETGGCVKCAISPLSAAVKRESVGTIKILVKKGALLDKRGDTNGPLLTACRSGSWNIARLLLSLGASINSFDKASPEGDVGPLYYALRSLRSNDSLGFIMDLLEYLTPPPTATTSDTSFAILQAAVTHSVLHGVKEGLAGRKTLPFTVENTYVTGTAEVQQVLLRTAGCLAAVLFVGSRQQAAKIVKILTAKHGSKTADDPADRLLVVYRSEEDLRSFSGLY